jgi:branched-chain amino acid transport system substrate-binding protein
VASTSYSSVRGVHPPTKIYATQPGYEDGWTALAKYYLEEIWKGPGKPKMAMHLLDNPTGMGPRFASMAQAEAMGIEIVADEEHSTKTISEIESLTRIKTKNADVLVIASTVGATATILKGVIELGMYPGIDILLVQPSFDKHVVEIIGADKAEGMYGVYATAMWHENPKGMAKLQEYAQANSPDHVGKNDYVLCWSHALIIAEVLRVALGNVGYDGLNHQTIETEGFRKVKDFDPEGLMGPVGWTDDYDRRGSKSLRVFQIQGGEFIPVSDWIPTPTTKYEQYDWFKN